MSRRKIITILVALGLLIVFIAVFRSCRGGHRPPAEQDALEGTSYRVDTRAVPRTQTGRPEGVREGSEDAMTGASRVAHPMTLVFL